MRVVVGVARTPAGRIRAHIAPNSAAVAMVFSLHISRDMDDRQQRQSLWRQASGMPLTSTLSAAEIAARAYEKYTGRLTRGESPLDDWLEAERELRQEKILPRLR